MATSKEYRDYIYECLIRCGEISIKSMMGEYLVYYKGKLVGDICDNTFMVKITPRIKEILKDNEEKYPYEGSKTLMKVIEDVEDEELMKEVLNGLYKELL